MTYAALLIDMQPDFLGDFHKYTQKLMFTAQKNVLDLCAERDYPLALVEWQYLAGTHSKLYDAISSVPRVRRFKKLDPDAFSNPDLETQLNEWDVDHLILMGVYASGCVLSTAKSAKKKGFALSTANQLVRDPTQGAVPKTYRKKANFHYRCSDLIKELK